MHLLHLQNVRGGPKTLDLGCDESQMARMSIAHTSLLVKMMGHCYTRISRNAVVHGRTQ